MKLVSFLYLFSINGLLYSHTWLHNTLSRGQKDQSPHQNNSSYVVMFDIVIVFDND